MELILAQIYLIICTLFLAGKDASSYLLKNKIGDSLTLNRIKRWHRDGVILNILFILPLLFLVNLEILVFALLIRLSVFDLAFNKWSGLDIKFLGSTSKVDQFFVWMFGEYGAIRKSLGFLLILILCNLAVFLIK